MRVFVAPGSYKGTIKSISAANVLYRELRRLMPTVTINKCALADGGEGTIEMLRAHLRASIDTCSALGPSGRPVTARRAWLTTDTVVIESSHTVGLSLMSGETLNPFVATSAGLGELIRTTIHDGARTILLGMGDSAVMDVGIGMLASLGVRFRSKRGVIEQPGLADLEQITDFDTTALRRLAQGVTFVGLVDTNDFLCGDSGQVALYGAQKGLRLQDAFRVEAGIRHFADVVHSKLGIDLTQVVRASGSGGIAAALHAFMSAELLNTLEHFGGKISGLSTAWQADVVVTGEGCLDEQTKFGKVPNFVATRSTGMCVAIVGDATPAGVADLNKVCGRAHVIEMGAAAIGNPRASLATAAREVAAILERF